MHRNQIRIPEPGFFLGGATNPKVKMSRNGWHAPQKLQVGQIRIVQLW